MGAEEVAQRTKCFLYHTQKTSTRIRKKKKKERKTLKMYLFLRQISFNYVALAGLAHYANTPFPVF